MSRMIEEESEPVERGNIIQLIGTISQQEHPHRAPAMDRPGPRRAGR